MKIHIPTPNSLTNAFTQTFRLFDDQSEVGSLNEADVVLTTSLDELRRIHRDDKFFGLFAHRFSDVCKRQPENVYILDATNLMNGEHGAVAFKRAIEKWQAKDKAVSARRSEEVGPVAELSRSYTVLIVDDSHENLELAMRVLPGQQICPVSSMEQAVRLLRMEGKTFDAVLTDMHMPPDKTYRSLNLDIYGIKETVPYGFAMMLEATRRGIPVAIVTDANYHMDWVSAMFSNIKDATVNGQKVLFLNNIGKRWDIALKRLMEP